MLKKSWLLVAFACFFTGCATFPSLTPPAQPKTLAQWHQSEEVTPMALESKDGKLYVTNHIVRTYDAGKESTAPKQNIFARLWGWLLSLGLLGGALAFFFPTAFFTFVLWALNKWRKLQQAYQDNKDALRQTVKAIDEANGLNNPDLKAALNKHQDDDSKKIIAAMRVST